MADVKAEMSAVDLAVKMAVPTAALMAEQKVA